MSPDRDEYNSKGINTHSVIAMFVYTYTGVQ